MPTRYPHRPWPRLVVILFATIGGLPALAQPVLYDVKFEQANWYQWDGALAQYNSLWGRLSFSYLPDDNTWYVNAGVTDSPSGTPVWVVRNLPIFLVEEGDYSPRRESVDINLLELGYVPGQDWLIVFYALEVTAAPAASGPLGWTSAGTVADLERLAADSIDEAPDQGPFVDAGWPAGIGAIGEVIDRLINGRKMNPVQEGRAKCCAGAFARSIEWLNREHGLGLTKTAQEIYDDLIAKGVSQPNADRTPARDEWISRKNDYCNTETGNKIVTKVWDSGNQVDAVDGVPEASGDFDAWLKREYDQGEDIEIAYYYPGNAHIITVTRVYVQDGKTYVKYRDDETQNDPNNGDSTVKTARIYKDADGKYHFGSDRNTIYFAVSESRVQEPSVQPDGGVIWTDPGDPNSNTSKDDRPIKDIVPPNGGSLRFYWTMGQYQPGQVPKRHPGYGEHNETNDTPETKHRRFYRPNDPTITDWYQVVRYAGGGSVVAGGNIRNSGQRAWSFGPLDELPDVDYRIPDLAPTFGDPSLTIYAAVNLELYLLANPLGFNGGAWQLGDTLDALGVSILNGQAPGLEGMYFALTDFTFDPESPTGWVPIGGPAAWLDSFMFQQQFGPIAIVAAHEGEAETTICPGDTNCDGQVDFGDINPFVLRLSNPAGYAMQYPNCPDGNSDINGNQSVGFDDINSFVALLSSGSLPIECP